MPSLIHIYKLFIINLLVIQAGKAQTFKTTETQYNFSHSGDSIVYQKIKTVDAEGRLIYKKDYFHTYSSMWQVDASARLYKEESLEWNPPILTQKITAYQPNVAPSTERLEIKYQKYHADEDSSDIIWARKYNPSGELVREDTCTYARYKGSAAPLLTQRCAYNFEGNTSLACDVYQYTRKNQLQRVRTYGKWTTVSMRGKPKTKSIKRVDFEYKYNQKGLLAQIKGYNDYHNQHTLEKRTYDQNNKLLRMETTVKSVTKHSKAARAKDPKLPKKSESLQTHLRTFQNGKLILEHIRIGGKLVQYTASEYKDSLLMSSVWYGQDSGLVEKKLYEYNPQNILTKRIIHKYDGKGNLRYSLLAACDLKGNIQTEVQSIGDKILTINSKTYDEEGHLVQELLKKADGSIVTKTIWTYEKKD